MEHQEEEGTKALNLISWLLGNEGMDGSQAKPTVLHDM
jgi:hypothetical protein